MLNRKFLRKKCFSIVEFHYFIIIAYKRAENPCYFIDEKNLATLIKDTQLKVALGVSPQFFFHLNPSTKS